MSGDRAGGEPPGGEARAGHGYCVHVGRMKTLRSPAGSSLDPPVVRSISFADQTTRDMGQVEWKKNERGSKEMFL